MQGIYSIHLLLHTWSQTFQSNIEEETTPKIINAKFLGECSHGLNKGNRKGAQITKEITLSVNKFFRFRADKIFCAGLLPLNVKVVRALDSVKSVTLLHSFCECFQEPRKIPGSSKTCLPQIQFWNLRHFLSSIFI